MAAQDSQAGAETHPAADGPHARRSPTGLSLGALGVVFGDIGTSPLYAIKECVSGAYMIAVTPENILGILSLVFWALTLVVSVKYLVFITRADNEGEGGILALLALVLPHKRGGEGQVGTDRAPSTILLRMLALVGAGFLIAEGLITPPISILGAMEGLELRAEGMHSLVVPLTIAILVAIFLVQRVGTGGIGRVFGPVMLVWFLSIAAAGLPAIARHPEVLNAINPIWALRFFVANGWHAFLLLGAVVLVVTGSEALYADMGHYGRRPIQRSWFAVVFPSLLLNYFGQGAILLEDPTAAENPFYSLTPGWTLYPMLALATLAAVIASQALISGVFSLIRQAVQLGYWPRVRIVHTSALQVGQIYIPEINFLLMAGCIAVALGFGSTSALAAAYGIAVTATMTISSLLFNAVARNRLKWKAPPVHILVALFLVVDVGLLSANANKIVSGGWLPLAVGSFIFVIMITWRQGRSELARESATSSLPLALFIADVAASAVPRVKGTAVFMTSNSEVTPVVMLHFFKHAKVIHEQVVLLSVVTDPVPKVVAKDMLELTPLEQGFFRAIVHVGFMQDPDIPAILRQGQRGLLHTQPENMSYFLGRETLLTRGKAPMAGWRKSLFGFLSRNARPATGFFHLTPNRVVELGTQIEL